MKIEKIRRWQWIVISLIIGFAIAKVRQMYGDDIVADYGGTMNSSRQFEDGILRNAQGIPLFKNLVVYPHPTKRDKDRKYYIVAGKYYSGRPERASDGSFRATWRPYCFPEKDRVYTPSFDLRTLNKPGGPDYAAKFKAIPNPTILDFIKIMSEARGTTYKYAWWAEPRNSIILWMIGSVVVIGTIWPSFVYLMAFGALNPPPADDSIDLSQLKSVSSTPAAAAVPTGPTQEQMDQLQQMEQKLMDNLAARSDTASTQPAPVQAPEPIRQLTATQSEVILTQEQKDEKAYSANQDDFYPTERYHRGGPKNP